MLRMLTQLAAGEVHYLPQVLVRMRVGEGLVGASLKELRPIVQNHASHRCRLQCVHDESRCVLGPWNNVDLLTLQFLHNGLNARTLHTHAGTDRINRAVMADHADLRTAARIAGSGLDFDNTVIDFRYFLSEQFAHEIGMRTAKENLLTAIVALNLGDDRTDPFAHTRRFTRDLLVTADNTFGAAKVDDHVTEFN